MKKIIFWTVAVITVFFVCRHVFIGDVRANALYNENIAQMREFEKECRELAAQAKKPSASCILSDTDDNRIIVELKHE